MKAFYYKGDLWIRAIPGKALFNSNLIHGVTVRGDIFAVRVYDQTLSIIPGKSDVVHTEINVDPDVLRLPEQPKQLDLLAAFD